MVVAKLPSDKTPRPDGFNGFFPQKVLAHNHGGELCFDFFEGKMYLQ
jgi:hypothetical protein